MTRFWLETWYWSANALAFFAWPVSLIVLGFWFWPWREGRRLARDLRGKGVQVAILGAMTAALSYASGLWDSSMLVPMGLGEMCGEGVLRSTWSWFPLSYVCLAPTGGVELVPAWVNPVALAGVAVMVAGILVACIATILPTMKPDAQGAGG